MSAFYSLVQYVPDLGKGERINIGVVAFDDSQAEAHFLENWTRVRQFGGNVSALQAVARQIEKMASASRLEALKQTMNFSQQSIQFTAPAVSTLDVDALLVDMARRCLVDPEQYQRSYRNRQEAVALTRQSLANALTNEVGKAAKKLLKPHYPLTGQLDRHECDIAVVNGKPILAANSLSFETPEEKEITKVIHATAWTIDDIKKRAPHFQLAVIALPPKRALEIYDRAIHTFTQLGAEVVRESELDAWSQRKAIHVRERLSSLSH